MAEMNDSDISYCDETPTRDNVISHTPLSLKLIRADSLHNTKFTTNILTLMETVISAVGKHSSL